MSKPRRAPFVPRSPISSSVFTRASTPTPPSVPAVLVDGRVLSNPGARARADAAVRVLPEIRLRGDVKLSYALDAWPLPVGGRTAVDVGAAAGGFTTALLRHGALRQRGRRRLTSSAAGCGQDLASSTSSATIWRGRPVARARAGRPRHPRPQLSVGGRALPHLERLCFAPEADLVALVKPTFELHRPTLAARPPDVAAALRLAIRAAEALRWTVLACCEAPPRVAAGRGGVHPRPPGHPVRH